MATIAFFGLGKMGLPMAANLMEAGHTLQGFDPDPTPLAAFEQLGGKACETPLATTENAEAVISMLPGTGHVEQLYLGEYALLEKLEHKPVVIDCTTTSPELARMLAVAASDQGIEMVDAPLGGGRVAARNATLTFMVGGSETGMELARPLLAIMGQNIIHVGGHGAGQTTKLCNHLLLATTMAATAEVLQLGTANGLDPEILSDVLLKSSARNWALEAYNPWPGVMETAPASNGYRNGLPTGDMVQSLNLAMELALASNTAVPLGGLTRNLYNLHARLGAESKDFSSIQTFFNDE